MTDAPVLLADLDPAAVAAAMAAPAVLTVTFAAKPWTHNSEKRAHRMRDVEETRVWRQAFATLARQAKAKPVGPSVVAVYRECRTATLPDVVASAGAAKAAIDGLKDAHVWPDDSPQWVAAVVFLPPFKSGRHALTLAVHPIWRDSRQKPATVYGGPGRDGVDPLTVGRLSVENVAPER